MRLSLSIGLCLTGQRRILSTLSQFWLLEATLANTFWESGFLLLSPHGPSLLFLPLKVFFTIIRKKAANSKSKTGGKISQWSKEAFPESQGNPATTLLFLQKRICEPQPFAFQFFLFISKLINFIPQVLARYQVCFKVSVLQDKQKTSKDAQNTRNYTRSHSSNKGQWHHMLQPRNKPHNTTKFTHMCICVQMIVTKVLCCSIRSRLGQTIKHQRNERRSTVRHLHMVLRDCAKRNKPVRKTTGTHRDRTEWWRAASWEKTLGTAQYVLTVRGPHMRPHTAE